MPVSGFMGRARPMSATRRKTLFPENQKVFRLDVEVRPALPVERKDPETGLLDQAQHNCHAN